MIGWLVALVGVILLLLPTAYAGYIGAPYVPTRRPALKKTLAKLQIGPTDFVVDLGAGDGGILLEAACRGAQVIGFELSPILWVIAKVRLLFLVRGRLKPWGSVYLRNFYFQKLPSETTVIYIFLMPKNLTRLINYLKQQPLSRVKYILSYTFALPNITPYDIISTRAHGALYVYTWQQL